jgi:hypothetical protein
MFPVSEEGTSIQNGTEFALLSIYHPLGMEEKTRGPPQQSSGFVLTDSYLSDYEYSHSTNNLSSVRLN